MTGDELKKAALTWFIDALRKRADDDADSASDVLDVLLASYREDRNESVGEIVKTVLELLEPERVGGIRWLTCKLCPKRLKSERERERGYCDLH